MCSSFFSHHLFYNLGSPLDFFHTPPTTPSEAELTAMALSSAASSSKAQTPSPPGSTTPSPTSPITEWAQKPPAPSEWAVISVDSSETRACSNAAARHGEGAGSPASLPPSRGSPSEESWQERDSGLEPQAAEERAGDEMTLVLLSLMEHYGASIGLTPHTDVTTGAVGKDKTLDLLYNVCMMPRRFNQKRDPNPNKHCE